MDITSDVGKLVTDLFYSNYLLTITAGWLLEATRSQRSLSYQPK
jgi:hypothetical protein